MEIRTGLLKGPFGSWNVGFAMRNYGLPELDTGADEAWDPESALGVESGEGSVR